MSALIHQAMQTSAKRAPDSKAVRSGNEDLLYKELNQGSAAICSYLESLKLEEEQCIGLFMDKRIDTILAIYGVLRAGAVYVPLDTKNPATRIQYIVEQCSITTLMTTPDHVDQLRIILSKFTQTFHIIVLTHEEWTAPSNSVEYTPLNPFHVGIRGCAQYLSKYQIKPENLAAILYTSGSTGEPKGVMMTHASVTIFIRWAIDYFQLCAGDRCISHAPLHFDLSLLDIFASLGAGATVVLVPDKMTGNPKFITQLISEQKITVWQSVPSALVLLLKYGDIGKHKYESLRHVLFAGERICVKNLKAISTHFDKANFHNVYGSTETNDSFVFSLPASVDVIPDPIPIGKPLPYVDFMIVDADMRPLSSPQQEGQLLVKTPTLMRGYRKVKQDVASLIKKEPASDSLNDYYPTKDIVRLLPDGNLVFCGRTDDIVKSNGYRVNVLEIENILQSHQHISDASVIPIPDEDVGNRIVATVVVPSSYHLTTIELKIFCSERLPKYAIPHSFEITRNPLPKTSSGKTNKKSLRQSRENNVKIA